MVNNLLYSFLLKFCKLLRVIQWFLIQRQWSYMLFITFVEINIKRWIHFIDKLTIMEVSKLIKKHEDSIISKLLEVLIKFIKWWLHFVISKLLEVLSKFIKWWLHFVISKLLEVLSKFINCRPYFVISNLLEVLIIL